MSTKEQFLEAMQKLNKSLNVADKCQPTLMQFFAEQPTSMPDMNTLDWIAVDANIRMIMKPVQVLLQQVLDTEFFKEVAQDKEIKMTNLIIGGNNVK